MLYYKKNLRSNHKKIVKYCRLLKRSKKNNININKLNELILNSYEEHKLTRYYYYPQDIFSFLEKAIKEKKYNINLDDIISNINQYQLTNNYHLSYWEINELPSIIYFILINKIAHVLDKESNSLLVYSLRKEKLIFNIFKSINNIINIDREAFIQLISDVDKELLKYDEYKNMDNESRNKYREQISQVSREKKVSEYQLIINILNKLGNKSIATFLFKRINYKLINIIVVIISFLLSMLICILLIKIWKLPIIIGLITILINYRFLYINVSKLVPKEFVPRQSFQNISQEIKVMCYKYCILKNTDEVLEQFKYIEQLNFGKYNMHFTLLVDCTDCDHQIEPFDDEILDIGLKECERLNKLYNEEKIYFVYRKRIKYFNGWYGYNRRMGAMEQFCKLLLNKIDSKEDYKYFTGHSLFKDEYKYIVETDDIINFNDFQKLIGILEHPYNKPIIKNNKLVYGYAMQSISSKNCYGECSYNQNGAFNLSIFNDILIDKIPNNILNLNLLRSNALYNNSINKYTIESITKNNIYTLLWSFKKDSHFNIVSKIAFINNVLNILIDSLTIMLLLILYLTNQSLPWLVYLILVTPNFSNLPNRCFSQLITLIKLFSDKYRNDIIEKLDTKNIHLFNYLFSLLLIFLSHVLKIDIRLVIIVNILFIFNDLFILGNKKIHNILSNK